MESIGQTLNQMHMPEAVHHPQELKHLRTLEEERLLKYRAEVCIEDGNIIRAEEAIKYAILKVGIRAANMPVNIEWDVLINHVADNYGKHTPSEIILAFDMAISGKLDVDPVCYENFSCLYFSSIMNAYRKWAVQAYNQVSREPVPYNKKQLGMKVHWGGEIETTYQQIKSGKFISYVTFPVEFYDQLCEDGFIEREPYLSAERKKKVVFELFTKAMEINKSALYARSDA